MVNGLTVNEGEGAALERFCKCRIALRKPYSYDLDIALEPSQQRSIGILRTACTQRQLRKAQPASIPYLLGMAVKGRSKGMPHP